MIGLMRELEDRINDTEGTNISLDEIMGAGESVKKGFTEDDADPKELAVGIKIEMEHTTNVLVSKKIALDHLSEIPDYYTRLVKMEEEAGVDVSGYYDILQ